MFPFGPLSPGKLVPAGPRFPLLPLVPTLPFIPFGDEP